jgi:Ca2+:H+ antiporter
MISTPRPALGWLSSTPRLGELHSRSAAATLLTWRRNAVELIVAIIALANREIVIVQTSLVGSILSNLLLVLGMSLVFSSTRGENEPTFHSTVAETAESVLLLAVAGIIMPTVFAQGLPKGEENRGKTVSRVTAIVLLPIYFTYLYFQYQKQKRELDKQRRGRRRGVVAASITVLVLAAATVGICSEFLVGSIKFLVCKRHWPQYFIGLILLPIIGNATKHVTAIYRARDGDMDKAFRVAIGSSKHIALFLLPFSVVFGWVIGADMTLVLDIFQLSVLFLAVLLVSAVMGIGKPSKSPYPFSTTPTY